MGKKIADKYFTILCDDVRKETGNKYSLMGVYGKKLILKNLPAVLPKMSLVVMLKGVKHNSLEGDATIRQPGLDPTKISFQSDKAIEDDDVNLILMASPFRIKQPGVITIEIRFFNDDRPKIVHKVHVEKAAQ